MKLTTLLIIVSIMQVSATGFAQRITLSEKAVTMKKIFDKISSQTGYDFLFSDATLKGIKPVSIQVKNEDLKIVLDKIFEGQPLEYSIEDKSVVVSKRGTSFIETVKDKITSFFQADSLIFKGIVLDVYGQPLPGASVKVKGTKKATFTTKEGNFVIYTDANATLQVSYIGYETQELKLRREDAGLLRTFNMKPSAENLGEVAIVSTGYQDLPKERATGSFEVITAKQLEHSTSPNLVKRLEGITTSLDFNNPISGNANLSSGIRKSPLVGLTIRGKNTLAAPGVGTDLSSNSGQVLVVIDGIPSPYSIDQINPDDVESINILKDAAAASIWGSRAANGVIVVKTKKGSYNKPFSVSFNTNVNISEKVDLFYKKYMSTSDFVDVQIRKYNESYPNPVADPDNLYVPQAYLSPVEEIINDQRLGTITAAEAKAKLDDLRDNEVRNDLNKYFLRQALVQNYSLALDGGSEKYAYRLSGGYSHTRENTVPASANRYNLSYSASVKPIKNLSVQAIVSYNESQRTNQAGGNPLVVSSNNTGFNPYAQLADDAGNPLVIPYSYRPKYLKFLADHYGDKILDMSFRPLEDMKQGYSKVANRDLNFNLNASYQINQVFTAALTYGYNYGQDENTELKGANSYSTREITNIFTTREDYVEPPYGLPAPLKRLIPLGGIYSPELIKRNNQTLRGQLNADKTWNEKHQLNALVAFDIGQYYSLDRIQQFYGFNPKTLETNNNIPFGIEFERLIIDRASGLGSSNIPFIPGYLSDFKTRTLNFSSNAAYTYDNRYTLSASIRQDFNSISGAATNRGFSPYVSVGGLWNLAHEKFYALEWLPVLQIRATFGYNGNVNALFPAKPIITYPTLPSDKTNLLYANPTYFTNRKLRPEKSKMLNLGVNFGSRGNRLSGSIEYFRRNTSDLITEATLDPTTGYAIGGYNAANLRSWGTDVTLNSTNLQAGLFRWTSNLTFSYNRVKVLKLFGQTKATADNFVNLDKVEGYELSRIAAYRWAGLDPLTGDPRGYDAAGNVRRIPASDTDPEFSQNITSIQAVPISSLHYFGSAVPVYYGAFRNTFSYAGFSLTAAFQYKLGYYFRKNSSDIINYEQLFSQNSLGAAEFARRWQTPGDEKITNVPSMVVKANRQRDLFYRFSEINVLKADHIRFQEINLSYAFKKTNWFLKNPRIYANVNNLGIVWRANKEGIDPDINDYPIPRTYGFGFSANF